MRAFSMVEARTILAAADRRTISARCWIPCLTAPAGFARGSLARKIGRLGAGQTDEARRSAEKKARRAAVRTESPVGKSIRPAGKGRLRAGGGKAGGTAA